jgi:hypothetical protein
MYLKSEIEEDKLYVMVRRKYQKSVLQEKQK